MLGLVFSIPSQEIGLGKRLRNNLFCVESDVKPQLSQSIHSRLGLGKLCSSPSEQRGPGGTRPKTKTILVHFLPEKQLLVHRILLHVAKCCAIALLK